VLRVCCGLTMKNPSVNQALLRVLRLQGGKGGGIASLHQVV
jgi:hypothetical protein